METSDFRGGAPNRGDTNRSGVSTSRGRGSTRVDVTNHGGAMTRDRAASHRDADRDFRQYQPFSMLHGNFSTLTGGNFHGNNRPFTSVGSLPERGVDHKPNLETSKDDDISKDERATEAMNTIEVVNYQQNARGYMKRRTPRTRCYQEETNYLLHCFVCNKNMSNGESFQAHVYGKAHKEMLDNLKQVFQNIISMLREHISLGEEKKIIELERRRRNIHNYRMPNQECISYCKMCDWTFFGKIGAHRMNEGHQRLKKFLHPSCIYCAEQFSSRLQWVIHHFTPNHLRNVTEKKVHDEDDIPIIDEIYNDLSSDESLESDDEPAEDLKDFYYGIPAYKPTQEVGKKHLKSVSGFYCDLCICFLMDEGAVQNHLQSEKHFNAFAAAAKSKLKKMHDEVKEKEMQRCRRPKQAEKTENPTSIKFEEAIANDDEDKVQDKDIAEEDDWVPQEGK